LVTVKRRRGRPPKPRPPEAPKQALMGKHMRTGTVALPVHAAVKCEAKNGCSSCANTGVASNLDSVLLHVVVHSCASQHTWATQQMAAGNHTVSWLAAMPIFVLLHC
jgi:hypothetical protein